MQIIQDYRALHQIPELGHDLPKTIAYIQNTLSPLSCRVFSPVQGSVCAWFDFGHTSALAFRADMDALPVTESTGLSYASCHPGQMHACGHDGHTAILLELARRLHAYGASRNVLLIFQPAEETTGGARDICKSGVLERCNTEAIFGLHVWPGLQKGALFSKPGAMMSRSCEVDVDITGRSAHITKAAFGADALSAGIQFYTEARQIGAFFGAFQSGNVRNCIPDFACLKGTIRAPTEAVFQNQKESLLSLAGKLSRQSGCHISVRLKEGYPAVVNPEDLFHKGQQLVPLQTLAKPVLATEDFSFYQQEVPGLFCFLGIGDAPALHSPHFHFDETVLSGGADYWETIARNWT